MHLQMVPMGSHSGRGSLRDWRDVEAWRRTVKREKKKGQDASCIINTKGGINGLNSPALQQGEQSTFKYPRYMLKLPSIRRDIVASSLSIRAYCLPAGRPIPQTECYPAGTPP